LPVTVSLHKIARSKEADQRKTKIYGTYNGDDTGLQRVAKVAIHKDKHYCYHRCYDSRKYTRHRILVRQPLGSLSREPSESNGGYGSEQIANIASDFVPITRQLAV
jgi:hypothetical protein